MPRIAVGIIGAGRIIHDAYLPIMPFIDKIGRVLLYDLDMAKVDALMAAYDCWLSQNAFDQQYGHRFADAQRRAASLRTEVCASTSLNDVVRRAEVLLICTPPSSHLQLAQECLDAGKLTLIEKPLASSSIAAQDFSRRNQRVLNHVRYLENFTCEPAFRYVKRMIGEGTYGVPLMISVFLANTMPTGAGSGWRLGPVEGGGGVLFDWGPHSLGLALYLGGQGYKVHSVAAECLRFIPGSCPPVESYALTSIAMKAASGRPLSLLVENSWECSKDPSVLSGCSWVSIALTKGTIRIDQKRVNGRKQYLINAVRHREEPASIVLQSEFPHESFYYSLSETLGPDRSAYASFSFGQQIIEILEASRGRELWVKQ